MKGYYEACRARGYTVTGFRITARWGVIGSDVL
jgi:hypothetical protein